MRYAAVLCVVAVLVTIVPAGAHLVFGAQTAASRSTEGWEPLFSGTSLEGWVARDGPDTNWHVEDGLLTAGPETSRGYLVTTREFDNFQLKVDFWLNTGANSGVFLRVPGKEVAIDQRTAVEVNISDTHKTWPTGSINEIARVGFAPATANQWNSYEITADGPHIVVKLNGVTTVDVNDTRHTRGPIGVQYCCTSGHVVKFKNIYVRSLPR
jgi:3-keto-disaccharide hydrolase